MKYILTSPPRISEGAVLALLSIMSLGCVGGSLVESGYAIHQLTATAAISADKVVLAKSSPGSPLPAKKIL